ncbi:MAG: TAT-variant-translocated molybdopterin oxidoreductase, partial [Bacteroidota bacterium]
MIDLPVLDEGSLRRAPDEERFWRSLDQLRENPHLAEDLREEFLPGASDGPGEGGATRRQFLQLMGASMALAGLTACRRPVETIMPYTRQPEEIIPGMPLFYATSVPLRGILRPVLVKSYEGRPVKVEGNPEHPISMGGSSVFEQASLINLYDPDRSQVVLRGGEEASFNDFAGEMQRISQARAARVAVLCEPTSSTTVRALRRQLEDRFPEVRWITYREEGNDARRAGFEAAFGRPVRPLYRFGDARVIVSLDDDFLGATDLNHVFNSREFARGRRLETPDDSLSRLYVVESQYSVTGGAADNRLALRSSEIPAFAAALAQELGVGGGSNAVVSERAQPFLRELAQDLRTAGSQAIVTAGESQPAAVHSLCAAINSSLGSVGEVVTLLETDDEPYEDQSTALESLVDDMRGGRIDVLLMIGVNPIYSASPAFELEAAFANVSTVVHLGAHVDETARAAQWHVPRTHYFEAWGDGRAYNGTRGIVQPLIAPLYPDTRSEIELLSLLADGEEQAGYDVVRRTWQDELGDDFDSGWSQAVHDGFVADSAFSEVSLTAAGATPEIPTPLAEDEPEIVVRLDPTLLDGSFANNALMQELPDPITKLVWDNVALMSLATAERLGVGVRYDRGVYDVDRIRISTAGGSVELPVWVMPGHADGSITVNLGYGRDIATRRSLAGPHIFDLDHKTDIYNHGAIATGVGRNVAVLRSPADEQVIPATSVEKLPGSYTIVT